MSEGSALNNLISIQPENATESAPPPTWDDATILAHEIIGGRYHRLTLHTPSITRQAQAGQFVMVSVPEANGEKILLPRPMAIHRRHLDQDTIEIIFAATGRGTVALAAVHVGMSLLLTGPLGRGFKIPDTSGDILLIGRGIGICGVMTVAEDAAKNDFPVTMVLSGRSPESLIGTDDCAELGATPILVTDTDGTSDVTRLTADLRQRYAANPPRALMVCGSHRLFRMAINLGKEWGVRVQVSIEAHMACGLGYCHGCAAPIESDSSVEGPLVCVDGPVFDAVNS